MIDKFIANLVNQKIPMPNSWQESLQLKIDSTKQSEFDAIATQELTGYKLTDSLDRGYIKHTPMSNDYSSDTQYLLGMYLRALRDIKRINLMPFYNCVTSEKSEGAINVSYATVLNGYTYAIYIDTQISPKVYLRYSNNGERIGGCEYLTRKNANGKFIFICNRTDIKPELQEYLELVIESPNFQSVSVLEDISVDDYNNGKKSMYEDLIAQPVFENSLSGKIKYQNGSVKVLHQSELFPSLMKNHTRWSNKLIQCLLDVSINEDSPREIKQLLLNKFSGSSVSESARVNTPGVYDINDYTDKRLRV